MSELLLSVYSHLGQVMVLKLALDWAYPFLGCEAPIPAAPHPYQGALPKTLRPIVIAGATRST